MNHPRHPAGSPASPIPIAAYLLPFVVLAVAAATVRDIAGAHTWSVLGVGFVVLSVLAAVGPLRHGGTDERYPKARRVALLALFGIMMVFSLCCAYVATAGMNGALGVYPAIIFLPAWFLFALLIPLWADSPVVRTEEPDTGWKQLGRWKLLYSDPDDDALWVYLSPQNFRDARSALYTPNLGHRWGRVVMTTFVVLLLAMIALLIATSRPTGLLP